MGPGPHVATRLIKRAWIVAGATAGLIGAGAAAPARAQQGPALSSFFMHVPSPEGDCCGNSSFAEKLPPERKLPLEATKMDRRAKGVYTISAPGAAPFSGSPPRSGFFVDVTAIGSNAHCTETSTLVKGRRDLSGTVTCVDPHGAPCDTSFSWSYRADSLDSPQHTPFRANFGYAQVQPDGHLGTFFTPAKAGDVSSEKKRPGFYGVRFARLGTESADMDPHVGVDVQVSNICTDDTRACGARVCTAAAWSVGATASSVDVQCADPTGAPVDGAFRVFIGQEALNSQSLGKFQITSDYKKLHQHFNEGTNYAWVSSSDTGPPAGKDPIAKPAITFMNKTKDQPGPRKLDYFHLAKGVYAVRFTEQIVYGTSYWSLHVTARETDRGTYCNIGELDFKSPRATITCFDGTGAPRDAKWFLSMRRLYN